MTAQPDGSRSGHNLNDLQRLLEREVLARDLTRRMGEGVAPLGLAGLGVIAGPMLKPVGLSHPLLAPADYRKARIGISDSVVADMFLDRLGASTTPLSFKGQAIDSYDGIEHQVTSVQDNQYDKVTTSIAANVNLWPRPITVVANTKALERLTDQQRDTLMLAADKSLDASIAKLRLGEQEATRILCRRAKVRFDSADEAAVTKLRAAARPIIEDLSKDEHTASALAGIEAMRTNVSAAADNELVPTCDGIAPELARNAKGVKGPLDGTWTMSETFKDIVAKGVSPDESHVVENYGDWVFLVHRERFAYTQRNGDACTWGYAHGRPGITAWSGASSTAAASPRAARTRSLARCTTSPGRSIATRLPLARSKVPFRPRTISASRGAASVAPRRSTASLPNANCRRKASPARPPRQAGLEDLVVWFQALAWCAGHEAGPVRHLKLRLPSRPGTSAAP